MSSTVAELAQPYLLAAKELRDNPGQWHAYESKGNCVILAGPGSGKTKTLTVKLARILAEDVSEPQGVACITFNTECAGELKRRLDQLGVREGKNIFIGTIHSFCLKHVLIPYARLAKVPLPEEIAVASPSEQEKTFQDAVSEVIDPNARPESFKTGFDKYRRTYLDRNSPEWRDTDPDTAALIGKYEELLHAKGVIDFDDMVLIGLRLITDFAWVRKCLKARFPVLAIDEYQDLGLPLHEIVLSLCFKAEIRILAVGDPDQSIYGFTGAQPELLTALAEMQGMEKVPLRFNYRSGKNIVDASEVALGEKRNYEAKGGYAGTIDFYAYPKGIREQAQEICQSIIPAVLGRRKGRVLGDVAVLYLDRNDGEIIEEQTAARGMRFIRIDKGAPYRKTPFIRWLEDCAAWCAGGWAKGKPRLSVLVRTWLYFNGRANSDRDIDELRVTLVRFLFAHREPDTPASRWLSDFENACLATTLAGEKTLRDEEEELSILEKALGKAGKLSAFTVALFGGQSGAPDHLNLITLHSAKGMEFDVVVMMGMDQGRLPSWAARTIESKREPRRLFYVGLTRARHEVHMTSSGFTVDRYGRRHEDGPSEFLLEVAERMKQSAKP
jgi:DNA helicase-2/ATP-dependent DNA helicase PcrA